MKTVLWKHQKIHILSNGTHHEVRNMKFVRMGLPIKIIPFSSSFSFCQLKGQQRLVRKFFIKQSQTTENFT